MAIGISYTGHDGRRMDFAADGNPEPGSELDRIVRGADAGAGEVRRVMTPLADAMRRARRPQGPDPRIDKAAGTVKLDLADHRPGTLADKVDVGGSIEVSQSGMRLKGDGEPRLDGLYAKKGGRRGFFSLDEIDDPNAKGGIVGEQDAANRFAASNKESGGNGAFSENMQSRTEAEVNEETGEVTFWEYTKRWDVTNGRRVGGVSGETKRKICSFFLGRDVADPFVESIKRMFTVVRTRYVDGAGKPQYEYWVRALKWDNTVNAQYGEGYGYYRFAGTYVCDNGGGRAYGHYPQRPVDRPKLVQLDNGKTAFVPFMEENVGAYSPSSAFFSLGANNYVYIGSSLEYPTGDFKLYGYVYRCLEAEIQDVEYTFDTTRDVSQSDNPRAWEIFQYISSYVNSVLNERFYAHRVLVADTQMDAASLSSFIQSHADPYYEHQWSVGHLAFSGEIAEVKGWKIISNTFPLIPSLGIYNIGKTFYYVVWVDDEGNVKKWETAAFGDIIEGITIRQDTVIKV